MFLNLLALKLEYAMSVYQKFRDCKTAGPFLCPRMIFARARACLTRSQGVENLLFSLCAPDISFQREFLIYVKLRADLQSKKFYFWSTIYPANFGKKKKHNDNKKSDT